jgi:hypothetical protein
MPYNAYVFARPGGAVILGSPYGHVAFGIQLDETNKILVGGVEVANGSISHVDNAMDFWTQETIFPLDFMSSMTPYGRETRYDMCKKLTVDAPDVAAAREQITRIASIDYNLLSQNCRTDTVEILEAFGVTGLPGGARPSGFFGGFHSIIIPLVTPWSGSLLDFSIYTETDQFGLRDDPELTADEYVADPTADVNPFGPDAPEATWGSILLRKGFLALFPEENFAGLPVMVPVGRVLNFRDVPWADPTLRSWYASATPFDPDVLAQQADNITPRFSSPAERGIHCRGLGLPPHFALPQQRIAVHAHA